MKRLNLKFPLVVAPMAGVASSVEFVVASSEAGALGSVKAGLSDYLSLWCGTGEGVLWTGSVAELVVQLFPDFERN